MDLTKKPAPWRRFWSLFCLIVLAAGLSASLLSCTSSPDGAGVSQTGYITVSGGVKLAYDLTLPAAKGRFPVALEYDDYSAGADNSANVAGSDAGRLRVVLGLIPGATAKAPLPACTNIAGEPCRHNSTPVPPGSLTVPGA